MSMDFLGGFAGGLLGGLFEGRKELADYQRSILGTASSAAQVRRSIINDLQDSLNLGELQGKIGAYKGAGFDFTQETLGRSIVRTTQNELATDAFLRAAQTDSPVELADNLREGMGYLIRQGKIEPERLVSQLFAIQQNELTQVAKEAEFQQVSLIRKQLNDIAADARDISATFGEKPMSSQLIVDSFAERAAQLGVPLSEPVKEALSKVNPKTLRTLLSRLSEETDFQQLEEALQSQDGSQVLRALARYAASAPVKREPASDDSAIDPIERRLAQQAELARMSYAKSLTPEGLNAFTKAQNELAEYREQKRLTSAIQPAMENALRQYGDTDPMGIPWSPQARAVMGIRTTLQAMGNVLPQLEVDPSPQAQEKAKQVRDAMASLNATLKSVMPVDVTPELIRAAQRVFPEHYNGADPVHLTQLMSSPTLSEQILAEKNRIAHSEEAQKVRATETARLQTQAQYQPDRLQQLVSAATGVPLGTPLTPQLVRSALQLETDRRIEEERRQKELELQNRRETTTVEESAKISLLVNGLTSVDELERRLIDPKTGKINRKALTTMATDLPGTDGGLLVAAATIGIWAYGRPLTGAASAVYEKEDFIAMYGPRFRDSDDTIKYKLRELRRIITGTLEARDPDKTLRKRVINAQAMSWDERVKYARELLKEAQKQQGEK